MLGVLNVMIECSGDRTARSSSELMEIFSDLPLLMSIMIEMDNMGGSMEVHEPLS